jgi:hypothetical protein
MMDPTIDEQNLYHKMILFQMTRRSFFRFPTFSLPNGSPVAILEFTLANDDYSTLHLALSDSSATR